MHFEVLITNIVVQTYFCGNIVLRYSSVQYSFAQERTHPLMGTIGILSSMLMYILSSQSFICQAFISSTSLAWNDGYNHLRPSHVSQKEYVWSTSFVNGCRNGRSNPLKDSYECHFTQYALGSVIRYGCLVRLVAMVLGCCVLLKMSRLVGVTKSDFSLRLPKGLNEELHLTCEFLKVQLGKSVHGNRQICLASSSMCVLVVCHGMAWKC